ncbi:MAG: EF-hand domain-containing protein [Chthoniobacterales bacterium]
MNSKTLLTLVGAASLVAGCATDDTNYPPKRTLQEQFERADTNQDGKVSKDEFRVLAVEDAFSLFDDNEDGVITRQEFLESGGSVAAFEEIDVSGSGKITLEEAKGTKVMMSRMLTAFYEADANDDGYVTLGEALVYRARARKYTGNQ